MCLYACLCVFVITREWKPSFLLLLYNFQPQGCLCQWWSTSDAYWCPHWAVSIQDTHDACLIVFAYNSFMMPGIQQDTLCTAAKLAGGQQSWEAAPPDICPWEGSLIQVLLKQQVGAVRVALGCSPFLCYWHHSQCSDHASQGSCNVCVCDVVYPSHFLSDHTYASFGNRLLYAITSVD